MKLLRVSLLSISAISPAFYVANAWTMKTMTSYQARVETYAPIWDLDNQVFVSGLPNSKSSSGSNFTFDERYRATMDSVTTSSVEGALMYLQRDCIDRGADPTVSNCQRKNSVSVITFLEIQIHQPNSALAEYQSQRYMYPEFCPFVVMEDGECAYMDEADDGDASLGTSSSSNRNHPPECKQFNGLDGQPDIGPCVGAQAFSADVVAPYYDTVWFSYPGSCVTSSWTNGKNDSCRDQYPSGLCPFGTEPDGVTCTYSYKILGYLSIDQLVGITAITTNSTSANSSLSGYPAVDNVQQAATKYYKNYNAFCKAGGIEFHSYDQDKTLGLSNVTAIPFWKKPSSLEANIARTKQMIALYNELVDESTNHMQKLPTDFDALRDKNPACYENGLACYDAALGCQRHSYAQVCSVCRGQRDMCVRQISAYSFPVLEKVSRTVSDSELRSGMFATLAIQTAAISGSGSTNGVASAPVATDFFVRALHCFGFILLSWTAMR